MSPSARSMSALRRMRRGIHGLVDVARANPIRFGRLLPVQHRFIYSNAKKKLIRSGNQIGKTHALLIDLILRCEGRHPTRTRKKPPVKIILLCATWTQSLPIQEKLWDLVSRDQIHPRTKFDEEHGFGTKNPMCRWKNGSRIMFRTTEQGGLRIAGVTPDVVAFDEPPKSPRVFTEATKRVLKSGGDVVLAFTPVNAPVDYIREMCEAGRIEDHHARLEPDELVFHGTNIRMRTGDGVPMDSNWIEEVIADTLAHEVPVVCHGEWEFRTEGNVFRAFKTAGPQTHLVDGIPMRKGWYLALGIDHGSGKDFSSVAVLVAVSPGRARGEHDRVFVLDEYVSDGETTEDMDAAGILAMLARNRLPSGRAVRWSDLKRVYGDRPWNGNRKSGKAKLVVKDNARLMAALERRLSMKDGRLSPPIRTVKRGEGHGAGSVSVGCTYLHRCMVRPSHFGVHPNATRLVESLQKWDYTDNEWKHIIDALRYACDDRIFTPARRRGATPRIYLYG